MTPLVPQPVAGVTPYGRPVQTQVLLPVHRCSTAHVVIAWLLAVLTGFYLLPWAVAATRGRRNVAAVALVALLLGWTVVGWVVALVMACGSDRPVVLVQHTYAPWPPPATWAPPAPQPLDPWPAASGARPLGVAAEPVRRVPAAYEPTVVDPFGEARTEVLPPLAPYGRSTHQR